MTSRRAEHGRSATSTALPAIDTSVGVQPSADIMRVATRWYLRSEPIDMSALAAEVGLSRATLYRRIGNHDQLLAHVLAERTARTFAAAEAVVLVDHPEPGPTRAVEIYRQFLRIVVETAPLRALITRDPAMFVRVVMAPGAVEAATADLIADLLERELAATGHGFRQPAATLAVAFVRIGDAFAYTHLLSGGISRLDDAVDLAEMLLTAAIAT